MTTINCDVLSLDFQGRRPVLILLWKRRCAVYQLTVAVATQMSHMLVYGADELHFLKALALVVWFSNPSNLFPSLSIFHPEDVPLHPLFIFPELQ